MVETERGESSTDGKDEVIIMSGKRKKGKGNKNMKKGFRDDQIRLLESMFESESKPDPRRKTELARELGLEPRQVAIWFQNRRARWKSKQVEQEYRVLRASYEKLLGEYESLKKEKQDLEAELQKLSGMLDKNGGDCEGRTSCTENGNSCEDEDTNCENICGDPIGLHECFDQSLIVCSPDDMINDQTDKSGEDGRDREFRNVELDEEDCSAASPEKLIDFGTTNISDYSLSNNNIPPWWNFWT